MKTKVEFALIVLEHDRRWSIYSKLSLSRYGIRKLHEEIARRGLGTHFTPTEPSRVLKEYEDTLACMMDVSIGRGEWARVIFSYHAGLEYSDLLTLGAMFANLPDYRQGLLGIRDALSELEFSRLEYVSFRMRIKPCVVLDYEGEISLIDNNPRIEVCASVPIPLHACEGVLALFPRNRDDPGFGT